MWFDGVIVDADTTEDQSGKKDAKVKNSSVWKCYWNVCFDGKTDSCVTFSGKKVMFVTTVYLIAAFF